MSKRNLVGLRISHCIHGKHHKHLERPNLAREGEGRNVPFLGVGGAFHELFDGIVRIFGKQKYLF